MAYGRNIKGITIEIGGDTTKLQTALKDVNSQIKDTQAQLRDVEKLLKLDPHNTELLAQKQRLLGDAIGGTREKLQTLKTAAEQAEEALKEGAISQNEYDALQREIADTENKLESLEQQAEKTGRALQSMPQKGEKLKSMGSKVEGVGKAMLPVSAAIAGVGAASVKVAADFDSAMSQVAAVSGAAGSDFDALRDKAREMGAKTKFSATEAAEAMNYMAMAGWKTQDMLGGIEGIMNLAAASGEDLATTSDIVTDALTAFGLSAKDSAHFADILAAASSTANTNVAMMGETFKYAAPVAGALGFTAEDTAMAIGLMANAGIKSSQAGTSLRSILTSLSSDFTISGKKIGDVTIATTEADGSMRCLSDILADTREAFSGLSASEQTAAAETLVGKNAMSGFLALMNAAPQDVDKLTGAITNCDGAANAMAEKMQDNLNGQLEKLKSGLSELAIQIGDGLMPLIRGLAEAVTGLVTWLNSLDPTVKTIITTIALVVAAIGPLLIIVGKVMFAIGTIMTVAPQIMTAIGAVKGALAGLNAVMLANPIGLIIAAIAALVIAFVLLWKKSAAFRNFWKGLWKNIKSIVSTVVSALKTFFTEKIPAMFRSVVTFARNFVTNFRNIIASLPQKMLQIGKNIVTGLWNGIKGAAGWLKAKISGFVDGIINGFKEFFGIHSPSKEMADQIGKWLPSGLGEGITGNLGSLQSAVDTMGTVVTDAPNLSPSALTDDISSAIGTGLAVQGSGASMPGSINVVVELGGTRVGEKIVNLYDYTKKAMG